MNRCPISYEPCDGLTDLPFSARELRQEAAARAGKMSIQGVQPKLSARLLIKENRFEIVDLGGTYILKPQIDDYQEVPENEDLTMRLASLAGIEVPLHVFFIGMQSAYLPLSLTLWFVILVEPGPVTNDVWRLKINEILN